MMGFIALILVVFLAIVGVRWATELRRGAAPAVPSRAEAERLERMESALAALEARLDDLQEQQRFMERLLAERPAPESLPPGGEDAGGEGGILFDTDRGEV